MLAKRYRPDAGPMPASRHDVEKFTAGMPVPARCWPDAGKPAPLIVSRKMLSWQQPPILISSLPVDFLKICHTF